MLYNLLVGSSTTGMSFVCTYKFSQDHTELFFGKIRSLFGFNNNPSATKFCSAYRKLLVHNETNDVLKGNCVPLERVPILTVSSVISATLRPPSEWRRPIGRPRTTWLRTIDEDIQPQNFGVHTAWRKARDREIWHQVVSTATLC